MKKVFTILMLALSLATFSQNTTKVVVLDVFSKGREPIRQSILTELKTDLTQAISDIYGFEGIADNKVDHLLIAEGFAENPRLSREQAERVANLSGTQYALMSEVSVDDFGSLMVRIVLVDLDDYQVMASESTNMNNTAEHVRKGCGELAQKIITCLPKPARPIIENKTESDEDLSTATESSTKRGEPEAHKIYSMPSRPQQLTSIEADKVSRHLNRADVCIEMNYIDNAIKEYNEIVKIAPGWANVYMYLGNTYTLKGDETSLKLANECYDIFLQLTDDQTLYYEAQDKLSRVEMMTELKGKEDENAENLVGTWKSDIHDDYTGQPWFVVDISKTSIPNRYQIILSPKSMMYNNIVNKKAYSDIIDGKIDWTYTSQETYIPSQTKYTAASAAINLLFGSGSIASTVGNVLVEVGRESDVGYTNIMDFDFIVNANIQDIQDDYYKMFSDNYIEGSCQMRGEHHQAGRSSVDLDTVRECNFLRGGGLYPVFVKVKEIGGSYFYGDIKLTNNNTIMNYSPYISKNEFDSKYQNIKTISTVFGVIGGASLGFLLSGLVCNGVVSGPKVFGNTFFVVTGIATGASLLTCIVSTSQWKNYLRQCYSIHNKQVDENIRKFSQRDQTSVSVNVGLTPTGVGVSLNF